MTMGIYINTTQPKEQWLRDNAAAMFPNQGLTADSYAQMRVSGVPVCLVDNGPITAAAVCGDIREFAAFSDPNDYRPKLWFSVPLVTLKEVLEDFEIEQIEPFSTKKAAA